MRVCIAILVLGLAACDPLTGTGPGNPPDPKGYIHSDPATHAVVITLIAGYPAGDYQFNYNGYRNGTLVISIPIGWQVTVQCENRGTVPNSCAVVTTSTQVAAGSLPLVSTQRTSSSRISAAVPGMVSRPASRRPTTREPGAASAR